MGLTEREQKLLEELERGLAESEPALAQKFREPNAASPRRLIAGALLALAGLSILVFAVMTQIVVIGVIAFLVMLGGLFLASSNVSVPNAPQSSKSEPKRSGGSFFDDRWDRRRNGDL